MSEMLKTCPTCGGAVRVKIEPVDDLWHLLSPREKEVVELLVELGTAPKVAEALGTREQTVKNQLATVREKTKSDTMVQAIYKLMSAR